MCELNIDELMKQQRTWYNKQYYAKNREIRRKQNKEWSAANKAHRSEYNKRYYEENKERIFAQRKADTAPAPKREKRVKPHKGLPVQSIPTKIGNY